MTNKLYLNQTDTGERNEREIDSLRRDVESVSMNVGNTIRVSQWTLAKVLDYLTVLEDRLQRTEQALAEPAQSIKRRLQEIP